MAYGPFPPPIARQKGRATSTDAVNHELLAAPGAGKKLWISKMTISNSSLLDTEVHLKSNNTIIWTTPAPRGGGALEVFLDPIDAAENEALNFAAASGVTTITVSISGFLAVI